MTKALTTFFLSIFFIYSIAQKPSAVLKGLAVSADCKRAIKLNAARKTSYGPTVAPKGYGKIMDIKACDKQDIFTFEKEHNSAWYYFITQDDGDLIFEISPVSPKNDYDFMLFKWTDSCFCDDVKQGYLLPVRTNLSRTGKEGSSLTGLSFDATAEHVPTGQGASFSKSIPVKKGEKYYLGLDNVYPKGDGHTVTMYYLKGITLGGAVINENKKPLTANVRVEDKNGKIISSERCNDQGQYILSTKLKDNEFYTLVYSEDSSFSECRQILLGDFSKTNYEKKDYTTTLRKLTAGKKYVLSAIYFKNKTTQLLPSSHSSLNALYRLLMNNPDMKIQIEGHTNNPTNPANTAADKKLGQDRAEAIYNYLLSKGIPKERMSAISYGSLFMLYPKPGNTDEINANNRVEVFFLPVNE